MPSLCGFLGSEVPYVHGSLTVSSLVNYVPKIRTDVFLSPESPP